MPLPSAHAIFSPKAPTLPVRTFIASQMAAVSGCVSYISSLAESFCLSLFPPAAKREPRGSEPGLTVDVCWMGGDRLLPDVLFSVLPDSYPLTVSAFLERRCLTRQLDQFTRGLQRLFRSFKEYLEKTTMKQNSIDGLNSVLSIAVLGKKIDK